MRTSEKQMNWRATFYIRRVPRESTKQNLEGCFTHTVVFDALIFFLVEVDRAG